jgi:hypothetical protein
MPKKVSTTQVPKAMPQNVPKQDKNPMTGNSLINLIRHSCMRILCKEIAKINHVTSKTHRPLIQIKGTEQKWLFDTGAGLTCMSCK